MTNNNINLAIIGLGYVGLPLAVEFGKNRNVIGFDINTDRIDQLKSSIDSTLEVTSNEINQAKRLSFTSDIKEIKDCNFFIITVPTPINQDKKPDLLPLFSASKMVGELLKVNDIVVYESTVYPGCTEDDCVPILEESSGLEFNNDFFCGYSPERINPGDKKHRLTSIKKVTSGSTPEVLEIVDNLYNEIIKAGTHKASSIKIAEAAKVIENTQRDVNIALINELSILFNKLDIDTEEVLKAAGSKWNFLSFRPGLVGGHCIGVDPYYLTHKSQSVGYNPEVILAGRKINDDMGRYVGQILIEKMRLKNIELKKSNVLVMGLTFKENCPDTRNTKVIDVINELNNYSCNIDVYDPWVNVDDFNDATNFNVIEKPKKNHYDAIVITVAHTLFTELTVDKIKAYGKEHVVIYDLKYLLEKKDSDIRL